MKEKSTVKRILKKSFQYSFSFMGVLSVLIGILGYSIKDIGDLSLLQRCFVLLGIWIVVWLLLVLVCYLNKKFHNSYETVINGITITIKADDLFKQKDWKVIPCDDRYNTQVDDKIISRSSLHGKMITQYVSNLDDLEKTIDSAFDDSSKLKHKVTKGKRRKYSLGRLIPYQQWLLLSASHLDDENKAVLEIGEYEQMLFAMWQELSRVYSGKNISIPLIGAGIMTLKGNTEKNYTELLISMLWTFQRSRFHPNNGINIVLTKDTMEKIDMDIIKEIF